MDAVLDAKRKQLMANLSPGAPEQLRLLAITGQLNQASDAAVCTAQAGDIVRMIGMAAAGIFYSKPTPTRICHPNDRCPLPQRA